MSRTEANQSRRRFIQQAAALSGVTSSVGVAGLSGLTTVPAVASGPPPSESLPVRFSGDGLSLSPAETIAALETILDERGIEADYYSRGGVVEELEREMAAALGKERAIYLPTGTLANHLALRALVGERTRAIVPHESHIYNDSGDCVQQLSQLNLVPLASESATFTLSQVREIVERTQGGRVTTGVGAIFIESPVRRRFGEMFDYAEMEAICAYARERGIGTHLDGARLYMASAYSGISPREYASHFDTVYVSLWKYFNSGSGAILAGSEAIIDQMFHTRRMFGSGLPAAWPFAALALHFFRDFESEFQRAVQAAEAFIAGLGKHEAFHIERIPNGSNLFRLRVSGTDLGAFRERLKAKNVLLSRPREEPPGFLLNVNPTLNRTDAESLIDLFVSSV